MIRWLLGGWLCVFALCASADTVRVAVAANFAAPVAEIAERFAQATGHTVEPIVGSTGLLFAQIERGAPFDAFLAADTLRPALMVDRGLAVPSSRFTYAIGRLVLWQPDAASKPTIDGLRGEAVQRIALASPRLAPYGIAAQSALEATGVAEHVQGKLVTGQNVGGTYALVASGNAQAGFVALSQVLDSNIPTQQYAEIPLALHAPIRQDAVLTLKGGTSAAARAFLDYLKSDDIQALIAARGYVSVGSYRGD